MPEQNAINPHVLFVGNLPYSYADNDLDKLFNQYGTLASARIAYDEEDSSRGFGFVRFQESEAANAALEASAAMVVENRGLRVRFARDDSRYLYLFKK